MQPGLFTLFIPGFMARKAPFPYLHNLVSCALTQFIRLNETQICIAYF